MLNLFLGYKEESPAPKVTPSSIITQSMGSSNLPSKKPGNAAGPAFSGNITSISSESYGGMMKGSPLDLKPIVPKREEKKPEDPNILEKAKLASMLFGGFTDSNADSKKKAANLFTGGGLSVKAPQYKKKEGILHYLHINFFLSYFIYINMFIS